MTQVIQLHQDGQIRTCGTIPPVDRVVGADFRLLKAAKPSWIMSQADIVDMLKDELREKIRELFSDPHWMTESDQLSWGSCQCWTVADMITILRRLKGINDGVVFSGSFMYSILDGGQNNGTALIDGLKIAKSKGTVPVSMCGPNDVFRQNTIKLDPEALKHRLTEDATFELDDWSQILSVAAQRGVVNFAIQADDNFANYKSGIVPRANGIGNHSITGIDVERVGGELVLVAKNHWNRGWGMNGFGYVTEASLAQTLPVHGCWGSFSEQEAES